MEFLLLVSLLLGLRYQEGVNDSQIDLDELREVIGSVSGIGEVRLNQIMDAIAAYYNTEETEQE